MDKIVQTAAIIAHFKLIRDKDIHAGCWKYSESVYGVTTPPEVNIDVAGVTELTTYSVTTTTLTLGGNFALNNVIEVFTEVAEGNANAYLTTMVKHIALVANIPE